VLQNIAVLSAGQTLQTDGKSPSMVVPVVTLLVDPQEAEALTLSLAEGKIQLVLRNSTDTVKTQTAGRQLHDLYGTEMRTPEFSTARAAPPAREPARRPAAPTPAATELVAAPQPDQMIIIRGATKKVEVFQ
jgi:Flp pilus assembly protein CpaB